MQIFFAKKAKNIDLSIYDDLYFGLCELDALVQFRGNCKARRRPKFFEEKSNFSRKKSAFPLETRFFLFS